jgi:hypothetical protein
MKMRHTPRRGAPSGFSKGILFGMITVAPPRLESEGRPVREGSEVRPSGRERPRTMLVGVKTVARLASRPGAPNLRGSTFAFSDADETRSAMRLMGVVVARPGIWGSGG